MVCEIVAELPLPKGKAYGLCDSWFTNKNVINAHFEEGYHLIGALKTNKVICPKGVSIQVKDFAQYIEKNDVCLVTVSNSKYWVYFYEYIEFNNAKRLQKKLKGMAPIEYSSHTLSV